VAAPPAMAPGTTSCFSNGTAVWTAAGGQFHVTGPMQAAGFVFGPQLAATLDQSAGVFPLATWPITQVAGGGQAGRIQIQVPASGPGVGTGRICDITLAGAKLYPVGPVGGSIVLASWSSAAYAQGGNAVLQLLAAIQGGNTIRLAVLGTIATGQGPITIDFVVFGL